MTAIEEFKKKFETGQKIFEQLCKLNDADLKAKVLELLDGEDNDILTNNCTCKRLIENESPTWIKFWYYDGIKLDWQGITMVSEHGTENLVVKFNKNFKL